MWLFLEATDVWLFRDGRPFDAGSDHRANSSFPPSPTTIQGAIRTELLQMYGVAFRDYAQGNAVSDEVTAQIGTANDPTSGSLRLRGPFLAKRQADDGKIMPYFPTPADILHINTEARRCLIPLRPAPQSAFVTNWPTDAPALTPCLYDEAVVGDASPEGGLSWISAKGLEAYLIGKHKDEDGNDKDNISTDNFALSKNNPIPYKDWMTQKEGDLDKAGWVGYPHLKKPGFFFKEENRLGIGIEDEQKRPSDGKLYTAKYIRLKIDVGLLIEVTGLNEAEWQNGGVLSLGGERKTARYSVVELAHWPTSAADGNKLYLATPTFFERGWQPKDWGKAGTPTAALVGRPQLTGGWDMANNRPKSMQRYVPPSSVYFFNKVLGPANVPVCDDQAAEQIGFGTTFIGRW